MKPMATKGAKRKAASKARAQFSSDPKYESCFKMFLISVINTHTHTHTLIGCKTSVKLP